MCGRFVRHTNVHELTRLLGARWSGPEPGPDWNIAPTDPVLAVRAGEQGREGVLLRWGLVPAWAKDVGIGSRMINARAEGVMDKPAFRAAFRSRRCLIPADGFYEWKPLPDGRKQPYYIHPRDGRPLLFAGLWERWGQGELPLETCTIITTEADPAVAALHDRMPVILAPEDVEPWLEPEQNPLLLERMLAPAAHPALAAYPVSPKVNKVSTKGPECIQPAADPQPDLFS